MASERNLSGRRGLVVGLARTGLASARFLSARGAEVTLTDLRLDPEGAPAARAEGFRLELGGHRPESFERADLVVVSPGVPWTHPLLQGARARGADVVAEVELAARFLDAPILAVTGTNGKTTTTALLGTLLEASGVKAFVGGNIGRPLVEAAGGDWAVVVAELSSFQLEGIDRFHPRGAALLNVTQDHLDRYASLDSYARAKGRIFLNQTRGDAAVGNADDPWCRKLLEEGRGDRWWFRSEGPVDRGAWIEGDEAVVRGEGGTERLSLKGYRPPGRHNRENALAAILLARTFGVPAEAIERGLRAFTPLRHRIEHVRDLSGVGYYDDSKGTTVDSVVRALEVFPGRVVLIAGGRDKGSDFSPLRGALEGKARSVVLIGEARPLLAAALKGVAPLLEAASLEEAVAAARREARAGDVVLLSPACASFDMFRDYEERGERFRRAVESLE